MFIFLFFAIPLFLPPYIFLVLSIYISHYIYQSLHLSIKLYLAIPLTCHHSPPHFILFHHMLFHLIQSHLISPHFAQSSQIDLILTNFMSSHSSLTDLISSDPNWCYPTPSNLTWPNLRAPGMSCWLNFTKAPSGYSFQMVRHVVLD